jgi:hypothetical protein
MIDAMIPMTKQMSRKRLEAAWLALGPTDYERPNAEQRLLSAVFNEPPYPKHSDFANYEEYAAAIRKHERAVVVHYSARSARSE